MLRRASSRVLRFGGLCVTTVSPCAALPPPAAATTLLATYRCCSSTTRSSSSNNNASSTAAGGGGSVAGSPPASSSSSSSSSSSLPPPRTPLEKEMWDMVHKDRLVVFLTGTPDEPRCRFTVGMVDILNQLGVHYSFIDIMEDEEICEAMKEYSGWMTYPQVYLDGELLGGFDVVREMLLKGDFTKLLKEKGLM